MAGVPVTIRGMMYPKDKSENPYPFTLVGEASYTGLGVGGGPIIPPDQLPDLPPDEKPEPPLGIWGGPWDPPHPEHPIVLPPDLPPVNPPNPVPPVHEGWNWSKMKSGWYYVYVPGPGQPGPKGGGAARR